MSADRKTKAGPEFDFLKLRSEIRAFERRLTIKFGIMVAIWAALVITAERLL